MDKAKLYIASSVGELNEKGNYQYDSNRSMKIHINSSETTFKAAEEARLKQDEERAYVLYMRYIDIYRKVKQSREFKKDPDHFGLLLGTKKVTVALSNAEVLNKSLKKRYEAEKTVNNPRSNDKNLSHELPTIGVIFPKTDTSTSKDKPSAVVNAAIVKPVIPNDSKSIPCGLLHKIQFSKAAKDYRVLIIDIRNEMSYEESHVRHDDCINVPCRLLTPGTICERIQTEIKIEDHLKRWNKRAEYNLIVMLDWFCEENDLEDQRNPLRCLFDALHKWDRNIFLQHAPVVLSGGYADWVEFYPQLTTNPKTTIPKKEKLGVVALTSLSDVDFSSLLAPNNVNWPDNATDDIKSNVDVSITSGGDVIDGDQSAMSTTTEPSKDIFSNWKISNASSAIASSTFGKDITDDTGSKSNISQPAKRKGIPVVNRETKPSQVKESVTSHVPKKDDDWDSIFSELDTSSGHESSQISRTNVNDAEVTKDIHPGSSLILDMQNRLEETRKKKEEDEIKRRELEEKMKLFELEQEMQWLEKEAAEEEKRRKQAEKDLAMKMRELRPSEDKSKTHEPAASGDKAQPDTPVNISDKKYATSVVEPTELKEQVKTGRTLPAFNNSNPSSVEKANLESVKVKKIIESPAENYVIAKPANHIPAKPVSTSSNQSTNAVTAFTSDVQDIPAIGAKVIPSRSSKPVVTQQEPVMPKTEETATPSVVNPELFPNRVVKPADATTIKPSRPLPTPQPSKPALVKPKTPSTLSESKFDGARGKNELTLSTSLPMNWEKRLDKSTGRYYYLDHNTKSSHWNLPSNVSVKRPTKTVRLKDEPSSSSSGLKRSSSTPNIAQLVDEQSLKPTVNRSSKPTLQKPEDFLDPPDVYSRNLAQLHPTYGARGPGQCGLYNLGNTCYMNSVLQCMFSTSLLARYFLTNEYKHDMNRENFLGSGGEISDGFAVLMKAVWNGNFKNVTPRDFRNTIGRFNTRFSSYSQQDSQELLLFLMDGLHEDLNLITKREYKEEDDNDNMVDGDAAKMAWDFHKRLNKSIIVELFQGQFKAATQCLHCRKTSRKFDVFMYLSLPLPSRGSCSITSCLDKFSEVEKLSGENKWFCPNCKQDRDAVRRISIWRLPPMLLIHLKRFSFSGRWGDKLQTNVSYPTTNLDMNKFVIGPKKENSFNLYAVSHHHGATMDSGHYVATCKNPTDSNWYKYDDHEVSKTCVPSGASSYILCYTRLPHTLSLST